MPSWWGKSSSKEDKKKTNRESIIVTINRKLKITSEEKNNSKSGGSGRHYGKTCSERVSRSQVPSRSPSPSTKVSRCQSFAERPRAQPLPLPAAVNTGVEIGDSEIIASPKVRLNGGSKPSHLLPQPRPGFVPNKLEHMDAEDIPTVSVSTDSYSDSEDQSDSCVLSPLTSDYENGYRTAVSSPASLKHKDHSPTAIQKNLGEVLKPSIPLNIHMPSRSSKRALLRNHVQNLQIPHRSPLFYAHESSLSSPSRSPVGALSPEQVVNCSNLLTGKTYSDIGLPGSGHYSSPGSGYNSGHNSIGGDLSGQLLWLNSRCSPECSSIPSPIMTSPGPSSRIHSVAVSPLHPWAGGAASESPSSLSDDGNKQNHRLPLPPVTISNTCPFSPAYSTATSPSLPRSPNRAENPTSPGSSWKKGRLLGRGTFGDVYLGFNRENGEMCAMKEVTLFSDDAKSKESVQQLGQEILLLSRLQHPNIVQYYGSEMVDDKLYIYLEYVAGGSIYKLLQDYGQFGEIAIRSYTQQILSGLAYLHTKNTVHRDIKGANILVDPCGRVKLADFGMAKHIKGQSCPLSFKGSPYWMAPEVIKNSNGCNLAVDIWSLGCTVLEMATTKPPWSQYEGVAAMFKIGNSKELPTIPGHLSDEGKDFVRQCLHRDPLHRPTAALLLEHPFVKNIAPLERPIFNAFPSEAMPAVLSSSRSMGIAHAKKLYGYDSEGIDINQSRVLRTGSRSSDVHTPNNVSRSASPVGSPLLHVQSPWHISGRMSLSPLSSPHTESGSSTPVSGDNSALPFHHSKQDTVYLQGNTGILPRSQNSFCTYHYRPALADCISLQLRDHVKFKDSQHLYPSLSLLGHMNP